jgi:hypothetical protein
MGWAERSTENRKDHFRRTSDTTYMSKRGTSGNEQGAMVCLESWHPGVAFALRPVWLGGYGKRLAGQVIGDISAAYYWQHTPPFGRVPGNVGG